MKSLKKLLCITWIASLALFTACGKTSEPSADSSSDVSASQDVSVQDESSEIASLAGTYHFEYFDDYGDTTKFSIRLRDNGSFTVMTSTGPLGDHLCSGNQWMDNQDGTFTTGATDNVLDLDFISEDGTILWTIVDDDHTVIPSGYAIPTEFLEKPSEDQDSLGTGIYTLQENNGFMDISWELLLRADGTYALTEVGRDVYEGSSYTIEGTTVICGPMINAPLLFTWANPEGFTVTTGIRTFAPNDGEHTLTEDPAAPLPEGYAIATGLYTLQENNGFMDISWELLLRADNTYALTEVGRDVYEGSSYTIEGSTVTCGPMINAPLLFTWANPEGFSVTTGVKTFAPNDGEHTLTEDPADACAEGTVFQLPSFDMD